MIAERADHKRPEAGVGLDLHQQCQAAVVQLDGRRGGPHLHCSQPRYCRVPGIKPPGVRSNTPPTRRSTYVDLLRHQRAAVVAAHVVGADPRASRSTCWADWSARAAAPSLVSFCEGVRSANGSSPRSRYSATWSRNERAKASTPSRPGRHLALLARRVDGRLQESARRRRSHSASHSRPSQATCPQPTSVL